MELKVLDFGVSEYRDIWTEQCNIQSYLVGCKKEHIPVETEYLLVGEHPSVYTIGFHGDITNLKVSKGWNASASNVAATSLTTVPDR